MGLIVTSSLVFVAGCVWYWKVSKPLAFLPTYEELKAIEEHKKKSTDLI